MVTNALRLFAPRLTVSYPAGKRLFDVAASIIGLMVLFPVGAVIPQNIAAQIQPQYMNVHNVKATTNGVLWGKKPQINIVILA
jgi:lipopolysaccharide/colanic/teichoic acid biosynthesis glycosyltransferase